MTATSDSKELELEILRLKAKIKDYEELVASYEDTIELSSKWINDSTMWYSDETLETKWQELWDRAAQLKE